MQEGGAMCVHVPCGCVVCGAGARGPTSRSPHFCLCATRAVKPHTEPILQCSVHAHGSSGTHAGPRCPAALHPTLHAHGIGAPVMSARSQLGIAAFPSSRAAVNSSSRCCSQLPSGNKAARGLGQNKKLAHIALGQTLAEAPPPAHAAKRRLCKRPSQTFLRVYRSSVSGRNASWRSRT